MKWDDHGPTFRMVAEEGFTLANAPTLKHLLLEGLDRVTADTPVVLDLGGIADMDSAGIQLVIGLYKSCQEKSLPFSVEVASASMRQTMHLCQLETLMTVKEVPAHG